MRNQALVLFLLALPAAQLVAAQSLGDVARREEARRRHVSAGRQYTNTDLRSESPAAVSEPARETAEPAGVPSPVTADKNTSRSTATAPVQPAEKRNEAYWRDRMRQLRALVQKARDEVAALEARAAALDARAGLPAVASEREVTEAALVKQRRNLQFFTEELERFEARARRAKVPADWVS